MKAQPRQVIGILSCLFLAPSASAQWDLAWTAQFGSSADDWPYQSVSDSAGGVYVAGYTYGSLGGEYGGGGWGDAFLARYDAVGKQVWVKQYATPSHEAFVSAAPDGVGGVFVSGVAQGGKEDAWLARVDAAGSMLWTETWGTNEHDAANAIASDGEGGVFIAGQTQGSLGGQWQGSWDIYVARSDAAGTRSGFAQFGSSEEERPTAVVADGAGGAFVTGYTFGNLGDPQGGMDAFLARFDGAGGILWVNQFGSDAMDGATRLASDGSGGVFVGGWTTGDFGEARAPGAFIAHYDAEGVQTWVTPFGEYGLDGVGDLTVDDKGGIVFVGSADGPGDSTDAYVARYDGPGHRPQILRFGTGVRDGANGIVMDQTGSVTVTGITFGRLGDEYTGGSDVFVAGFSTCYSDFNGDGVVDLFDFLAYVNAFNAGQAGADCDDNGDLDLFDFLCFVNAFNTGC